jgi:hypothetical protein
MFKRSTSHPHLELLNRAMRFASAPKALQLDYHYSMNNAG